MVTIKVQIENLCRAHAYDSFQDGMEDDFDINLSSLISRYKHKSVNIFLKILQDDSYPITLRIEILKMIGTHKDISTHQIRKNAIIYAFSHEDVRMRDAALTSLEMLNDTSIVDDLQAITECENVKLLYENMKNVIKIFKNESIIGPRIRQDMYMRVIEQQYWVGYHTVPADAFNDFRTIDNTISVFKIKSLDDIAKVLEGFAKNRNYSSIIDYSLAAVNLFTEFDVVHNPGELGNAADNMHYDIKNLSARNLLKIANLFNRNTQHRLHVKECTLLRNL